MTRQTGWVVGGALLLGLLIYGVSHLSAQRPPQPGGEVGRYVVVRSSADVIVIMDTTTGDLYNAVPSDIKPYAARGQGPGRFGPMTPMTAKAMPTTKPVFKEALPDRFKDVQDKGVEKK
jgi:hypothetical protein